jgi:hypothetical protein
MKEYIVPFTDEAKMEEFEALHGTNGELIRCKDCRYNADCVCVWHSVNDYTWVVDDDDYCSCAEPKKDI